ncbi:hypothetical protein Tco_0846151 [Tanacetum coccineum]
MLSLRERMELDLEARLMGETLVLNRSLDPLNRDYIELNDLNVPLELRRDQVDDLMPTIEEGKVVEEFRARNDARMVSKILGYPSEYDNDKKIRIDCAYNLKFSCMIVKEKLEYKGNNVVRALMNIPIFVGTFSVLTDSVILEDMEDYRDEGMGDVSDEEKMNGISHSYQKLKEFYKGVLNLGPDFIRDPKMEEWLTREHISMHEME